MVPAENSSFMLVTPAALIEIGLPSGSNAKLPGAVIVEPDVVHVELSISAMNASLYALLTYSENSSDRNRKSMPTMQFVLAGTFRSISMTVTSKSVLPRTGVPPRSLPEFSAVSGSPAIAASPVVSSA